VKGEPAAEVRVTEQDSLYQNHLREIIRDLLLQQKMIAPKFFYDERGSRLFEQICELPEYYLTRTELAIMRECIDAVADCVGPRADVIEFGSGAGLKTRLLLEHLHNPVAYLPVDISGDHLEAVASEFARDFPSIEVLPVVADFTKPFPLPEPQQTSQRNLVYFPGSTIGNFTPDAAHSLLRVMHEEAGENGALLIGIDLKKDASVLERAYNDAAGVTAAFNLNVLRRLNGEFGFDFDLGGFEHRAVYDAQQGRIEMRLVSRRAQQASGGGRSFEFAAGEYIITEYSHKYGLDDFSAMARRAGFEVEREWTDPQRWFAILYCERI
jgi:dimethylhistidine N-methyltransferase